MTAPKIFCKARRSRRLYRDIPIVLALGIGVIFLFRVVVPALHANTSGFAAYYTASYLMAHAPQDFSRVYEDAWFNSQIPRAGIYGIRDVFDVQPPTMALILRPLVRFAPRTARWIWTLLSLLFLLGGVAVLTQRLGLSRSRRLWVFSLCLLYAPIAENLENGQAYLFLFCLLCLLFWALAQPLPDSASQWHADLLAGAALGLMLVLKTGAVWLWPLLLLWGRYRTLLWATLIGAGVALLSLAWFGLAPWQTYASNLPRLATAPVRYVTAYQTVTSLLGHLMVYDAHWNPKPAFRCAWLARALTLAVLLLSLAFSARWTRPCDFQQGRSLLSLALFGTLIVANAPLGEGYHYTLVLPSLIVAFWWAGCENSSRQSWAVLILAALLMGTRLPYMAHRFEAGWWALFAYPRVYGAYLLWGWLGGALARMQSRNAGKGPDTDLESEGDGRCSVRQGDPGWS